MMMDGKSKASASILAIAEKLTGGPAEFSMEARIFHATCVVSLIAVAINIPMNYLVGVPFLALLMTGLFCIISFIYYYSRFQKKLNAGFFLYCLLGNVFFIFNYYQNSGINGPSLLIFLLSLFLIITISPKAQFRLWVPLNIIVVGTLLFLQYSHPQSVPDTYPHVKGRYIDFAYSYLSISLIILFITLYIRNSYNKQRVMLLEKAAELESANETKNKLMSVAAHDLRAPLASIQNYLEMLNEYQLTADEKRSMEHDLLEKTKNTGQMLSNLLLWTTNQMGGVMANLGELHLQETLKTTIMIQGAIAGEKCIGLINKMDETAWVVADVDMLQLVIRNLLNNAIKFTAPGGEITINSELRGTDWHILVSDNGIGITDERKATIFSIRNRSTYGTRNEKGTGLGLLLCKEFTELQCGTIDFESIPGKGTTFDVSLKSCRLPENIKSGNRSVDMIAD